MITRVTVMEKKKGMFWLPLIISWLVYYGIYEINIVVRLFTYGVLWFIAEPLAVIYNLLTAILLIIAIFLVVYATDRIIIFPLAILIFEFSGFIFGFSSEALYAALNRSSLPKGEVVSALARPILLFGAALGVAAIIKYLLNRKKKSEQTTSDKTLGTLSPIPLQTFEKV